MTRDNPSDKQIIERYISGDKTAIVDLVKKWHKIFCEKAFWVLHDRGLSKDVAQECWIIIINKLHTLKNPESFNFWALRIIYTKAIDAHKRRTKVTQDIKNVDENYLESDAREDRAEIKLKLLSAIKELPVDKQDVISLFYIEEYSLKEISVFLQIPVGTVKSRLFKAREKLKSILKSYHYEK